jgi:formate hydrogenlyase subunit 3/multisubunit Na+/H+ antiporter MnhD subunit
MLTMIAGTLLASAVAIPLAMLATALSRRAKGHLIHLLPFAPLPALLAAIIVPEGTSVVLPHVLLGLRITIDRPGAMLLGAASLLWAAGGVWARELLRSHPDGGWFAAWWITTLTGSLGVFLAADLIGFYVFFTLVSLAAYGLVVHDGSPAAHRAAGLYIALALIGEAFLLMGFVLLAAAMPRDSLLISDAVAALPTSPWRDITLLLIVVGFGLKMGLVPFHVWMPLTYLAAPIPAAAVLSGAAVKAGVIGLIRFLPFDAALPSWGEALAAVGFFSALYGVFVGVTQMNAQVVLAYSSVSQMGFLAAVLGTGLAAGNRGAPLAAAFYAVHHMLAKGGLFLALGVASARLPRNAWLVMLPAAVLALGLAGLPITGGQLAKWVAKGPLGDGAFGALAQLSAVGSTVLMLHFLHCLHASTVHDPIQRPSAKLVAAWLTVALASVALPWILLPAIAGASWSEALSTEELWSASWPILTGGVLAAVLWPWRTYLPRIPEGDVLAVGERCAPAVRSMGATLEGVESALSQWTNASMCVVLLVVLMAAMLVVT